MKNIAILILLAISASSAVVVTGFITRDETKYDNDFFRLFPSHAAEVNRVAEIPSDRYRLAGLTNKKIYLYDRTGVLEMSLTHADRSEIKLDFRFGSEVVVDSPYFFIFNSEKGALSRGGLATWITDTTFEIERFTAIQPISKNRAISRKIDINNRKNILQRTRDQETYTLQKQVDGILCTDGILQYSQELHQLVYLYRYRNQFICLDTCLNVLRYGKTIDTTSVAKIAVKEIDGKITMAKPPLAVNNDCVVDRKYLFVQSNLTAKNELPENAKDRSVIDVYDLEDRSYKHSFYIDNYMGTRMQGFLVKDSTLVAIFKHAVVIYDLASSYLP